MNAPIVTIDGRRGVIFEGELSETYCFVPQDCIVEGRNGEPQIDEGDYVRSGWDVKNMRYSPALGGEHLFPRPDHQVSDLNSAPVQTLLDRLQHVP